MLGDLENIRIGLGYWAIAIVCALFIVGVIGLGFYLLGPLFGCILALILVILYSIARMLSIKRG